MSPQKMTKDGLVQVLSPLLYPSSLDPEAIWGREEILDVDWALEEARANTIIFYRLKDRSTQSQESLWQRASRARYGLLVLNEVPSDIRIKGLKNLLLVKDEHFLQAQKVVLDLFYPLSLSEKKLIGVTGTNGKSTTVDLARQVSSLMGHKAASLGTLGIKNHEGKLLPIPSGLTTPPYIELRKILHRVLVEEGHEALFMEVSSHALAMKRIYGLSFNATSWMSFSQDHLDFHVTMEEYFRAKKILFLDYLQDGGAVFVPSQEKELRESLSTDPNIHISPPKTLSQRGLVTSALPFFLRAEYNQGNLEVAYDLNEFLWREDPLSYASPEKLRSLEGRFSLYRIGSKIFIVDFAHTPDALKNICQSIKQVFPGKKLLVLFGCGGDRDPLKRPLMGKAADSYGDEIILTSDNPRSEDPGKIVADILQGICLRPREEVRIILEREQAIAYANGIMNDGDILLIAGKGHESYQIMKGIKRDYNDVEELRKLAARDGSLLEEVHDQI